MAIRLEFYPFTTDISWAQDYNASLNLRSTLTKDGKFSM